MSDLDVHLSAIRAGDADAFARFLASAEPILRRSLTSFARFVDVEAVLQESLLRVWQVAPRVEDDGAPNGLLRVGLRIARNLAISERRRLGRVEAASDEELDERAWLAEGVSEAAPDPILRRRIEECEEKLPDKPRAALVARVTSEGGEADHVLAERLGMRLNTFLQNFTRARRFLAECLEAHGIDLLSEAR